MIDLFGIKARQECLSHLRKIRELEDKIETKDRIIEMQAQRIHGLKNPITGFGSNLDYPNSH